MSDQTALGRLIAEPKGKTTYTATESFLLHVFWGAPSLSAAQTLLSALTICAKETHRNTPCVPTYIFRISKISDDITSPPPKQLQDHPQLSAALRKVKVGMPVAAVEADLVRRGLDPSLLKLEPTAELPAALQQHPVMLEFTELYLDDRAFMEHAGSREYLKAYGTIMTPGLMNSQTTLRMGTPTKKTAETILDTMLKATEVPVRDGCAIWNTAAAQATAPTFPFVLSLEIPSESTSVALPLALTDHCTTFNLFPHPLRPSFHRLLCVFPTIPPLSVFQSLSVLRPIRGEAHLAIGDNTIPLDLEVSERSLRKLLDEAGLGFVLVNAGQCVGYAVHEQVGKLSPVDGE
ncbi:hypothetical protein HDV00_007576 [Rhizophlyctis rosea]|nr:hypothetical protein HDV00_007576 [Rhizophlyctis rosea]